MYNAEKSLLCLLPFGIAVSRPTLYMRPAIARTAARPPPIAGTATAGAAPVAVAAALEADEASLEAALLAEDKRLLTPDVADFTALLPLELSAAYSLERELLAEPVAVALTEEMDDRREERSLLTLLRPLLTSLRMELMALEAVPVSTTTSELAALTMEPMPDVAVEAAPPMADVATPPAEVASEATDAAPEVAASKTDSAPEVATPTMESIAESIWAAARPQRPETRRTEVRILFGWFICLSWCGKIDYVKRSIFFSSEVEGNN